MELWAWDRRVPVARSERLAVGQDRETTVACQSLSGVTSRGVKVSIFVVDSQINSDMKSP